MKNTKYTLITNLSFIQLKTMTLRLNCHALLISEKEEGLGNVYNSLRGFGIDSAWDVFQYWLADDSLPFVLASAQDNSKLFVTRKGKKQELKPLFSGLTLTFKTGEEFFLQSDNNDHPLDVFESVGNITNVWNELAFRTDKYWDAPYRPYLHYDRPHMMEYIQRRAR